VYALTQTHTHALKTYTYARTYAVHAQTKCTLSDAISNTHRHTRAGA